MSPIRFSELKDWLLKERQTEIDRRSKKYEALTCPARGCEVTALVHRRHHAVRFVCPDHWKGLETIREWRA